MEIMSHLKKAKMNKAKKEHLIATKVTQDIKRKIDIICEEENRTTANFLQKLLSDYFYGRSEEFSSKELHHEMMRQEIK